MRTDRIKAALLGIFVLSALALLIWFALFLRPIVGDGGKILTIYSPTLDGIVIGTRVTYAGKPVGEVKSIETLFNGSKVQPGPGGELYVFRLQASVDSSVHIYSYDRITLSTQGLLGEKSIAILPSAPPKTGPAPTEITNSPLYIKGQEGIETFLDKFGTIGSKVESTLDRLAYFFDENTLETKRALVAVSKAAEDFSDIVDKSDLPAALNHLDQASLSLRDASIELKNLVVEVDQRKMLDKLSSSLDSMHSLIQSIDRGEGTLGKLLKSDCLHVQLQGALCRLDLLLKDMNDYGLMYQWDWKWQRNRNRRLATECCSLVSSGETLADKGN